MVLNSRTLKRTILEAPHAGKNIPRQAGHLGLAPEDYEALIQNWPAGDPGSEELTRALAASLNVPAVLGNYHRFVIDLNRTPEKAFESRLPQVQMALSALSDEDRSERIQALFNPYYDTLRELIRSVKHQTGIEPLLISIHTFDSSLGGKRWPGGDIGFLCNSESASAICKRCIDYFQSRFPEMTVDLNKPYDLRDLTSEISLPDIPVDTRIMIEVRNNLLETRQATNKIASRLKKCLDYSLT